MNRTHTFASRLMLLIFLLALPALACSTLSGDGDEEEPAAETTGSDQAAAADTVQEAPVDSQDQEAAADPQDQAEPADAAGSGESTAIDEADSSDEPKPAEDQPADEGSSDDGEAGDSSEKSSAAARDSIISALKSGLEVEAMRMQVLTEDLTNGVVNEVVLAFVRPNRYQLLSEGTEIIIIDDTTYMNSGNGEWLSLQGTDMTSTVESMFDSLAGDEVIAARQETLSTDNVNYEGKETINGIDMLIYSFGDEGEVSGFANNVKMWLGEDDGLLYRQEIYTLINGAENQITMAFEYGENVTIEPPQ